MTVRAVIFDMDGVLIDAREWHFEALNRALALFGFEISRFDHLSTYDGLPTRRKLEMLSIERDLPRPLHGFLNELKQRYTMELVHASCKPSFHHEYALSRLQREGYRLGVASNSVSNTVHTMMEKSGLRQYLDVLVSNEDVKNGKPDPEIYHLAMQRLQVEPRECLIVEDNDHGIRAARASGAHVLVVGEPSDVTYLRIIRTIQQLAQEEVR